MQKTMDQIKNELGNMNKREKFLMILTLTSVLGYLSYTYIFQKTVTNIINTGKIILALKTELTNVEKIHNEVLTKADKLKGMREDLETKEKEEKEREIKMQANNQIDGLLLALENIARKSSIELENMSVKTKELSKTKEYSIEKTEMDTKATDEEKIIKRTIKIKFLRNKIKLSWFSKYDTSIKYLDEIQKLPFAISFSKVDLTDAKRAKSSSKSKRKQSKFDKLLNKTRNIKKSIGKSYPKGTVYTDLELDIYFRNTANAT